MLPVAPIGAALDQDFADEDQKSPSGTVMKSHAYTRQPMVFMAEPLQILRAIPSRL
jgi:hypothetical protein